MELIENTMNQAPITSLLLMMAVLNGILATLALYRSEETESAKLCMLVSIGWLLSGQLIYTVWGV